jgi:hypothetical protein
LFSRGKGAMNKLIYFTVIVLFIFPQAKAQQSGTPYLERVLTISLSADRLDGALKKISQQAGFTFSYSPAIVETDKVVSYNFVNKTVREILDQLFNGTIQYKVRGSYIILTKAEIGSSSKEPKVYSGYVVDEATGERLKNVSIYDPVTLSSTVTDSYGYFEIEIPKPDKDLRLAINKQNYTDTLVVPQNQGRLLNIPLKINREKISSIADTVGQRLKRFWQRTKVFTKQQVNMANIEDTLHRKSQVSLVPFIGTNHSLSGNIINDYSFNIIGGYSLGVRKLELGGVFNIVRGNVEGAQFAGTFNAVGGNVKGAQLGGVFNANYGDVEGGQFAGIFNFNWGSTKYFSGAGVFNFTRLDSRAVQLAGIGNITLKHQESPQFAGLFNFSGSSAKSQLAGSYNFVGGNLSGWQAAGILNFAARDVSGAQTSGLLNFTGKKLKGVQIAGVLNYATRVEGAQIGLINIADSLQGVSVGLLSIVLKGYHKFEISADEVFYTNLAFRTGVRKFYNILTVGVKPSTLKNEASFWTFGYGIGTAPKLMKKLFLNVDVTSQQIMQGNSFEALNILNKAYLGVDFQLWKKMSITAGATLNHHVTETEYDGYWNVFSGYKPEYIYEKNYSSTTAKMWIGGKIGLRFL